MSIFNRARRRKRIDKIKEKISFKSLYGIILIGEVLLVLIVASGVLELVHTLFEPSRTVPDIFLLVSIGILVSLMSSFFLTKFLSAPIKNLQNAMKQVAEGDFSVKLESGSGFEEMKQMMESFNSMTKELAATEILQMDFVSNVSHEFKTPISAIEGYATLLQNADVTEEERAEYVEKILFNTSRLSTLVGNMLLLSKIDNQGIADRKSKYRLDEQIRQSILSLESRWEPRECEFDVDLDEIEYLGNETLLIHVWNNLLENAIKFGPHAGLIKMRLCECDEHIVFTIEDEGPGISESDKKHIFDRFYQTDSSHKSEGNGLGLALVKQIIKMEGGEISVDDGEICGTKFTVRLKKSN